MYDRRRAQAQQLVTYRVQLGHNRITVRGSTPEDALRRARAVFCQDLPRLWDVIHQLEASRFQIEELHD